MLNNKEIKFTIHPHMNECECAVLSISHDKKIIYTREFRGERKISLSTLLNTEKKYFDYVRI